VAGEPAERLGNNQRTARDILACVLLMALHALDDVRIIGQQSAQRVTACVQLLFTARMGGLWPPCLPVPLCRWLLPALLLPALPLDAGITCLVFCLKNDGERFDGLRRGSKVWRLVWRWAPPHSLPAIVAGRLVFRLW